MALKPNTNRIRISWIADAAKDIDSKFIFTAVHFASLEIMVANILTNGGLKIVNAGNFVYKYFQMNEQLECLPNAWYILRLSYR
eukprot:UN34793